MTSEEKEILRFYYVNHRYVTYVNLVTHSYGYLSKHCYIIYDYIMYALNKNTGKWNIIFVHKDKKSDNPDSNKLSKNDV